MRGARFVSSSVPMNEGIVGPIFVANPGAFLLGDILDLTNYSSNIKSEFNPSSTQ